MKKKYSRFLFHTVSMQTPGIYTTKVIDASLGSPRVMNEDGEVREGSEETEEGACMHACMPLPLVIINTSFHLTKLMKVLFREREFTAIGSEK